jgi:hypothetical protein
MIQPKPGFPSNILIVMLSITFGGFASFIFFILGNFTTSYFYAFLGYTIICSAAGYIIGSKSLTVNWYSGIIINFIVILFAIAEPKQILLNWVGWLTAIVFTYFGLISGIIIAKRKIRKKLTKSQTIKIENNEP